ncbi:unnamed protein product [Arctogadus glacialis]
MASSAPKRARVCEEETVFEGYLHRVTPVKIAGKNSKYFECILQVSRDKYRRAVVFEAGKHGRFEQAAAEHTPLKLGNVKKRQNGADFEILINRTSTLEVVSLDFDYKEPSDHSTLTLAQVAALQPNDKVTLLQANVCFHLFSVQMSAVGITENAKGDNKKFEIWCNSREEVYIVQAPSADVKTTWVNEIRKVLTTQLEAYRASQQRVPDQVFQFPPGAGGPVSPLKSQRSLKKGEEKRAEPSPDAISSSLKPAVKGSLGPGPDETAPSPTSDRAAVAKKRFTLQGFSNLKPQREPSTTEDKSLTLPLMLLPAPVGSPTSPDHKTKRHEIKSDPTPFGFKGWTKASNDGYSSAEEPLNSDPEEEAPKRLSAGKYTVVADCERPGAQELAVASGDTAQLVKEGEDGQWFVQNLKTSKEGWVAAANLLTLIGPSQSCQSLTSSEGSGSGSLSTSSSCSET